MNFQNLHQTSLAGNICFLQKDFQQFCEQSLKPFGLTNGRYFYLIYLNKHANCSLHAISTAFKVNKAHTTRVIAQLEQAGFVRKESDPQDSRACQLTLTAAGEDILVKIQDIFNLWDQKMLSQLTPESYQILLDLLVSLNPVRRTKEISDHV